MRHFQWLSTLALAVFQIILMMSPSCNGLVYEKHRNLCAGRPVITRKHEKPLQWLLKNVGETNINNKSSFQREAACFVFNEKKSFSPQRYVLSVLYYATKGAKWDFNTDWMTNKHECSWYGVKCNLRKKVIGLDLGYIKVDGLVPRELGLLTGITDLDLHGNDLQGIIPYKLILGLKKMTHFRMHMNGMYGALQKEIANMKHLKELYLFGNYISGTIPSELSQLKKLQVIDIYANQLEGTIPKELAKIPNLQYLDVHDNNLVGTMPKEICQKKLKMLVADCHGRQPEVRCDCCHICCAGLPSMICVDQKTGKEVDYPF